MRTPALSCLVVAFFTGATISLLTAASAPQSGGATAAASAVNLALVAETSTSYVSGHETITALNDGRDPADSNDKSHGAYGNWPRSGTQWVQYEWSQPISTNKIDVYWFDDGRGVRLPKACRLKYWDGSNYDSVENPSGPGLAANKYNTTTFTEVSTTKLRLELDSNGTASTGLLEWKVYDSGKSPNFAPSVKAGTDRVVVLSGKTYLNGTIKDDGKVNAVPTVTWSKDSGPGTVVFGNANAAVTTASFSAVGAYVLKLTADDGQLSSSDPLNVVVDPPPPATHLAPVYTSTYKINSPLWSHRIKKLIVNWIPHCYDKISDPNIREGGIENFVQAGNKLAGRFAAGGGPGAAIGRRAGRGNRRHPRRGSLSRHVPHDSERDRRHHRRPLGGQEGSGERCGGPN